MSIIKLVVSDLHLADGTIILDCFGESQQLAFEGLLYAASLHHGPLSQADSVELIINGDCFDFLVTMPYTGQRIADQSTALQKCEKIIVAHSAFFKALQSFVETPGRSITFISGNHDLELCFAEVRARICSAIVGTRTDPRVQFCLSRVYRPFPDIFIEHGHIHDFWNHATQGIWNEEGQPLMADPQMVPLSIGSWYFQSATNPISIRYPYYDHFDPPLSNTRQIALLCLLDPALLRETAQRSMQMLRSPRLTHIGLPVEQYTPEQLFGEAMLDFAAFRDDMWAQKSDWSAAALDESVSVDEMMEFAMVRDALSLPRMEAVAAICTPAVYQMAEDVAQGMHAVLDHDAALRYAIAGHTHIARIDPINQGAQTYLNTASWTSRFALPAPGEVTPALVDWLQSPDWDHVPLRDVTQYVFALITAEEGGSASASLCVWEGGLHGSYRVLA